MVRGKIAYQKYKKKIQKKKTYKSPEGKNVDIAGEDVESQNENQINKIKEKPRTTLKNRILETCRVMLVVGGGGGGREGCGSKNAVIVGPYSLHIQSIATDTNVSIHLSLPLSPSCRSSTATEYFLYIYNSFFLPLSSFFLMFFFNYLVYLLFLLAGGQKAV